MKNILNIQMIAKAKVLPCDLYVNEKVSSHIRKTGMVFKCYFDKESILIRHLIQMDASKGTDLKINYNEIDNIKFTLCRIPYGSLYGVRYFITLNFIINLKDTSNYELETSAFKSLENIQDILRLNHVNILDEIGICDIVLNKNNEEIQTYFNNVYDEYIITYGLENMRMTNNR